MGKAIRFGVVRLGRGRAGARQVLATDGAELVAICEVDEERGRKAAAEFGVHWHRSYDELLARDDVDVIGVYTPTGMHGTCVFRRLERANTSTRPSRWTSACKSATR